MPAMELASQEDMTHKEHGRQLMYLVHPFL